jgi:hypothetical protein
VTGHLEAPLGERNVRVFSQVEHRPVLDFVLADRKARHAVTILGAGSGGPLPAELHVHTFVERNLALDVGPAACDQIGLEIVSHRAILERFDAGVV